MIGLYFLRATQREKEKLMSYILDNKAVNKEISEELFFLNFHNQISQKRAIKLKYLYYKW